MLYPPPPGNALERGEPPPPPPSRAPSLCPATVHLNGGLAVGVCRSYAVVPAALVVGTAFIWGFAVADTGMRGGQYRGGWGRNALQGKGPQTRCNKAVGGDGQSGWGRLLSVTNAIEASCRGPCLANGQTSCGWGKAGGRGGGWCVLLRAKGVGVGDAVGG